MKMLDGYFVDSTPKPQNILDIFSGEWSSKPPSSSGLITAPGHASLFEDPRINWAIDLFGGVNEKIVLEIGPLEGAHYYMLHEAGAAKGNPPAEPRGLEVEFFPKEEVLHEKVKIYR